FTFPEMGGPDMAQQAAGAKRGGAATEQIPREEWEQFLNEFTEFNAEMPVRIEIVGSVDTGIGEMAEHQPLLDVTLDDEAGIPMIVVECGDPAALSADHDRPRTLRHIIRDPTAIWARKTEPAGWDALEIQGGDGSVILSLQSQGAARS